MRYLPPFLLCLVLVGCATSTGVMPLGQDLFRTSASASPSRGGASEAQRLAINDAVTYCQQQGRQLQVVNISAETTTIYGGGKADVTFKCTVGGIQASNEGYIIAQDLADGTVYAGKTVDQGSGRATLSLAPFEGTGVECRGQSVVTAPTPGAVGALGTAKLLCNDGRSIAAEFTFETAARGYGVGADDRGRRYRFLFGYDAPDAMTAMRLFAERFPNAGSESTAKQTKAPNF